MAKNLEQIKILRDNYERACNAYVQALNEMWELGDSGWWSDVGETYHFLDTESLRMDEIIYCVENNISLDEYFEWSEYYSFAHEFNQNYINLKSWHMGYHGIPKESQENLRKLKQDFEQAIKDYKETF